jgi:hypothetical protein
MVLGYLLWWNTFTFLSRIANCCSLWQSFTTEILINTSLPFLIKTLWVTRLFWWRISQINQWCTQILVIICLRWVLIILIWPLLCEILLLSISSQLINIWLSLSNFIINPYFRTLQINFIIVHHVKLVISNIRINGYRTLLNERGLILIWKEISCLNRGAPQNRWISLIITLLLRQYLMLMLIFSRICYIIKT